MVGMEVKQTNSKRSNTMQNANPINQEIEEFGKVQNLKAAASGRRDMYEIDPRIIKIKDDFNVRMDYGNIESLVEYIIVNGNVPLPIKVHMENGYIYVTDGHRRIKATMIAIERGADIKTVSCFGEPKHYNDEMRIIDMVVCNEGLNLSMLEQGVAFLRLVSRGYKQEEIAKKAAKSQSHVSQCIKLSTAPKRIQNLIVEGLDGIKADCHAVLAAMAIDGATEDMIYDALVKGAADAANDGRAKVNKRAVQNQLGTAKPSAAAQMKALKDWIEEYSVILKDNPKFQAVQVTIDFIKGMINIEELLTRVEDMEDEE